MQCDELMIIFLKFNLQLRALRVDTDLFVDILVVQHDTFNNAFVKHFLVPFLQQNNFMLN